MTVMFRLAGAPKNTTVTLEASLAGETSSATAQNFRAPQVVNGTPLIDTSAGQYEDDAPWTVSTGTLTGPFTYIWREVGGSILSTTSSFDPTGHAGKWVEVQISNGSETFTSPPVMVYMSMAMASHNTDDKAVLALLPHDDVTDIKIADGNHSDPTTWHRNRVPGHGARPLVPRGRKNRYDMNSNIRLDVLRVDGEMNWATDVDTKMVVETLIGTRGSKITFGTEAEPLAEGVTAHIEWSGRDYRQYGNSITDLNLVRDPRLIGRGFLSQGQVEMYGAGRAHGCLATAPVLAGETSLTLEKPPTGWKVGDTIVISGMELSLQASGLPWSDEDEERVISSIDGNTIHWVLPLAFNHNDKFGVRNEVRPSVQLLRSRNLVFESEAVENAWQRGHCMFMHAMSRTNVRYASFIEMGRTDKSIPSGIKNGDGNFETHDENGTASQIVIQPFTARSNLQGRYPVHWHFVGHDHEANGRPVPIFWDSYIEGSPGWGGVHHGCEMQMFNNSVRRVWSGGLVAESGNETGAWNNNIISLMTAQSMNDSGTMVGNPKGQSENGDRMGDPFRHGQALALRSRAVVCSDNIVFNATSGINFTHRRTGDAFVQPIDLDRDHITLKSIGQSQDVVAGTMDYSHHPLLHLNQNTIIGTWFGFFVTKEIAPQFHDAGIRLLRNTVWGCLGRGLWAEYVVTYGIDNWDIVMSGAQVGGWGRQPYHTSTNAFQIAFRNCLGQGTSSPNALAVSGHTGSNGANDRDVYDPDNRRFYAVGNEFGGGTAYTSEGTQSKEEVMYEVDDWDNSEIDPTLAPSHTYPRVIATWNGSSQTGSMSNLVTNTDGAKITNFTSAGKLAEKPYRDTIFATLNANARTFCLAKGYYELSGGGYALLSREIISDELSARPEMFSFLIECSAEPTVGVNNGVLDEVTTPIVASDKLAVVSPGGSVTIDVVDGATGGNGTIVLDDVDFYGADRGKVSTNIVTGEITYTPYFYVQDGTDEFYILLRSGDTMFKMVRVSVLIGAGAAAQAPVENVNFTVAPGASAGEIDVELLQEPDTGGRPIRLTEYSIDNGGWRRLTPLWPHRAITIDVDGDGNAIPAGGRDVRLRVHHYHENANGIASADAPVAVT